MRYTYYIIQDKSLDKDKIPEKILAKYDGDKFLAAIPLPKFAKIDDELFNKKPRIPKKNVEIVFTKQDLNRDGVKEIVLSIFHKNKYIVSLPANIEQLKKNGGTNDGIQQPLQPLQQQEIIVKNQTGMYHSMINAIGTGFGLKAGFALFDGIANALSGAFSE